MLTAVARVFVQMALLVFSVVGLAHAISSAATVMMAAESLFLMLPFKEVNSVMTCSIVARTFARGRHNSILSA